MSSIVVAGDTSGSVTLQAPAVAGSSVLTLPAVSGTVLSTGNIGVIDSGMLSSTAQYTGFKNRIINGGMVIDQRNAGAGVTVTGFPYTLDRWQSGAYQASKYTVQQNAGSVTPPVGFTNYLGVTSLSSYSLLTADYFTLNQIIEGFNVADLAWGAANAATVTLSFWARSSLTGTFGGSLRNGTSPRTRSYPFSYTINSANTWEQKSITIAGDTTGTWITNNGAGLELLFGLGVGPTYSGTAGSWSGSNFLSATGAVSVVGTSGATFYITGVQLEKGSVATSFDQRAYSQELAMCQRYLPAYNAPNGSNANVIAFGQCWNNTGTSNISVNFPFQVQPRSVPTGITVSNVAHFAISKADSTLLTSSAMTFQAGLNHGCVFSIASATGIVIGNASYLVSQNASAQILFTGCEL